MAAGAFQVEGTLLTVAATRDRPTTWSSQAQEGSSPRGQASFERCTCQLELAICLRRLSLQIDDIFCSPGRAQSLTPWQSCPPWAAGG